MRSGDLLVLPVAAFGLVAALSIWFGRGGWLTFAGIGLFLLDLLAFLLLSFWMVDRQFRELLDLGVAGEVEGIDRDPD
jgi:hypothetical protein